MHQTVHKLTNTQYKNLYQAILDNDLKLAKKVLKNKKYDFKNTKHTYTLLSLACKESYNNNTEMTKILLQHGADKIINQPGKTYRRTNMYWACHNNNLPLAKLLLRYKETDINVSETFYNTTPVWYACHYNNIPMLKELLKNGGVKSINTPVKIENTKQTPIYTAANKNFKLTQILAENGASLEKHLINYYSMPLEIRTYLKFVFAFDETKEKLFYVISEVRKNNSQEKSQILRNILRLLFCRSFLEHVKQSRVFCHVFYKKNAFFRLVQEAHKNNKIAHALYTTFDIQGESLLSPENFPLLLKYIIEKIDFCAAQTPKYRKILDAKVKNVLHNKKDSEERVQFIRNCLIKDHMDDYTAKNTILLNFIDNTKITVNRVFLS